MCNHSYTIFSKIMHNFPIFSSPWISPFSWFFPLHVLPVELPETLPEASFNLTSNEKFRYYQNVCTPGYTFVFWKWIDWEPHLDWMALNGINMPLAFTAQEAIWIRTYKKVRTNCSAGNIEYVKSKDRQSEYILFDTQSDLRIPQIVVENGPKRQHRAKPVAKPQQLVDKWQII